MRMVNMKLLEMILSFISLPALDEFKISLQSNELIEQQNPLDEAEVFVPLSDANKINNLLQQSNEDIGWLQTYCFKLSKFK